MNVGRFASDIHKFAPLNRTSISLLLGRSGPFDVHTFAPKHFSS